MDEERERQEREDEGRQATTARAEQTHSTPSLRLTLPIIHRLNRFAAAVHSDPHHQLARRCSSSHGALRQHSTAAAGSTHATHATDARAALPNQRSPWHQQVACRAALDTRSVVGSAGCTKHRDSVVHCASLSSSFCHGLNPHACSQRGPSLVRVVLDERRQPGRVEVAQAAHPAAERQGHRKTHRRARHG